MGAHLQKDPLQREFTPFAPRFRGSNMDLTAVSGVALYHSVDNSARPFYAENGEQLPDMRSVDFRDQCNGGAGRSDKRVGQDGNGVSTSTGMSGLGANDSYAPEPMKALETPENPMTWRPPMPQDFVTTKGFNWLFHPQRPSVPRLLLPKGGENTPADTQEKQHAHLRRPLEGASNDGHGVLGAQLL